MFPLSLSVNVSLSMFPCFENVFFYVVDIGVIPLTPLLELSCVSRDIVFAFLKFE